MVANYFLLSKSTLRGISRSHWLFGKVWWGNLSHARLDIVPVMRTNTHWFEVLDRELAPLFSKPFFRAGFYEPWISVRKFILVVASIPLKVWIHDIAVIAPHQILKILLIDR